MHDTTLYLSGKSFVRNSTVHGLPVLPASSRSWGASELVCCTRNSNWTSPASLTWTYCAIAWPTQTLRTMLVHLTVEDSYTVFWQQPHTTHMSVTSGNERSIQAFEMEDFVTYYVCHGLQSVQMTGYWIKLERQGISWNQWRPVSYFGHIEIKKSECGEADIARNNTGISHKMQTESNMDGQHSSMDWSMDTHWTRHSCILKTESSGDSSFMVWPSLGTRMAEGKARQGKDIIIITSLCCAINVEMNYTQ